MLDAANILVSYNGGLHLLAGKRVEPVCGGLLATISVLRLSSRLLWRWKVVKKQRAVEELGDQKMTEQPTIQSSFGGLSIGRQCHNMCMSCVDPRAYQATEDGRRLGSLIHPDVHVCQLVRTAHPTSIVVFSSDYTPGIGNKVPRK